MSKHSKIWNTKLVNEVVYAIENGMPADTSCFWGNNPKYRAADINFDLTQHEMDEFVRCAEDVVYFANKYAHAMTDDGIQSITMRPYQEKMLEAFQDNREVILLASRQIGKTITSGIFLAWYICFHFDRNVLIVANKQATAAEIVSKIKVIIENLPFFMKPGVLAGGTLGLSFDNGCRLFSSATTKTSALGFTIHLLYADEFAHIQENFVVPFYRSIYPTLSSSKVSKIIISSTPNGLNLFYRLFSGSSLGDGSNTYVGVRVDWWEVPGRDDAWKEKQIANLGSAELFEQEYGNKFIASSTMLLSGRILSLTARIATEYIWKELHSTKLDPELYKSLKWHPLFDPNRVWGEGDKFVISVDIADGIGRDYTVFNIFKLEPMSIAKIRKLNTFNEEEDFFRLVQVGRFHSNVHSVEDASIILNAIIYDVLDPEDITIILEMNFKGSYLVEKMSSHPEFYEEMFVHTKHSIKAPNLSLGIRLNRDNKQTFCRELKNLMDDTKIVITCEDTLDELSSFGLDDRGNFSGQGRNDDLAMSCVNVVTYFNSDDFYENVEDVIDTIKTDIYKAIYRKIEDSGDTDDDMEVRQWLANF